MAVRKSTENVLSRKSNLKTIGIWGDKNEEKILYYFTNIAFALVFP